MPDCDYLAKTFRRINELQTSSSTFASGFRQVPLQIVGTSNTPAENLSESSQSMTRSDSASYSNHLSHMQEEMLCCPRTPQIHMILIHNVHMERQVILWALLKSQIHQITGNYKDAGPTLVFSTRPGKLWPLLHGRFKREWTRDRGGEDWHDLDLGRCCQCKSCSVYVISLGRWIVGRLSTH